jgi:hypothetical protein
MALQPAQATPTASLASTALPAPAAGLSPPPPTAPKRHAAAPTATSRNRAPRWRLATWPARRRALQAPSRLRAPASANPAGATTSAALQTPAAAPHVSNVRHVVIMRGYECSIILVRCQLLRALLPLRRMQSGIGPATGFQTYPWHVMLLHILRCHVLSCSRVMWYAVCACGAPKMLRMIQSSDST